MIMSREQAFLKARSQLEHLCKLVVQASEEGWRVDEVERTEFAALMEIGRNLLQAYVNEAGDGDVGPTTVTSAGQTVQRLEEPRQRRYLSIFGELEIRRRVYARREGQKIEGAPLDERLGLPASEFSYVLEDWLQRICIKESFNESVGALRDLLGVAPSGRAAERMNQRMAEQAEAFRLSQPAPPPEEEAEILVATADGKGVLMRRPLEERVRTGPRRGKEERGNKKQMSYVGAVYSIGTFPRSAQEILDEVQRRERSADRPQPQHKTVWAELTTVREGEECTGRERLFIEMAIACDQRDPKRQKPLVCLMDGEAGLWQMQKEWLPRAIGILDLFHVLERLWAVAHCFHPERSRAAEQFVTHYLQLLLEGQVGYVIGGLRRRLKDPELRGKKRQTVTDCIRYYENNRDHMHYDEYLAAGYPIGSGVAEGACRHLVKDRMEQTGMRWTPNGAQAMLHLRAIYLNGDWKHYVEYRIQTEQAALYGRRAA